MLEKGEGRITVMVLGAGGGFSEGTGGGGDEHALPVHNWRQQGAKQHLWREKEPAWNGGALVQHCCCCLDIHYLHSHC